MILLIAVLLLVALGMMLKYLYEEYLTTDVDIQRLKGRLEPVFPELGQVKLIPGTASYTLHKSKVYICLRDKVTNRLYDDNMLTYVTLHELAHTLCDEIGHTEKFFRIFQTLLERAERHGLYDPSLPRVSRYCE